MNITDKNIDNGKAFDWGRTSADYAKFRDIYPEEFYGRIVSRNLCVEGQRVLDLGTGTGVLHFPDNSFDVVTAYQCFWYFVHEKLEPELVRMLKPGGHILLLYMAWLPYEDKIAGASEALALRYNPSWSGAGETMHPIFVPEIYRKDFELSHHEEYLLEVPFTRESWHGRMKTCRGVGASLTEMEISSWEREHIKLLNEIAPAEFTVLHYGALAELSVVKSA